MLSECSESSVQGSAVHLIEFSNEPLLGVGPLDLEGGRHQLVLHCEGEVNDVQLPDSFKSAQLELLRLRCDLIQDLFDEIGTAYNSLSLCVVRVETHLCGKCTHGFDVCYYYSYQVGLE